MKLKNLIFLILIIFTILVSGCNQATSSQPPKTTFQPVAWLSGQPGAANLTPTEGNGPFQCAITVGTLPAGFTLNNCVISGTAPVLGSGTTKSISPPFTITITNAAGQQQTLEYNILTVASLPSIIFNEPGTCIVKQKCSVNLIAQVNGGVPPYHFQSDTFANGAPPMGMIIDVNGVLTGIPSKTGQYTFGVCVVDVIAASKCGQTSVFVIDEEEPEEIPSGGESGELCSSNSGCTGFATNNCDAPQNVRCGGDGLCHCCLTLCPGGENCRCIDCSTGCGGGTYCEGDVCVFEAGGYPNEEQTTEAVSTIPQEESKDIPETWSGTLAGTSKETSYCVDGEFSYSFSTTFTVPRSIISALQGKGSGIYDKDETKGTLSGTASVLSQVKDPDYADEDCRLEPGSVTNIPIYIGTSYKDFLEPPESELSIYSVESQGLVPGRLILRGQPFLAGYGGLILKVKDITPTTISGTWGTGQFGEGPTVPHGTFTLTK